MEHQESTSHHEAAADLRASLAKRKSVFILRGGWRHEDHRVKESAPIEKYKDYPLVQSMIKSHSSRQLLLEQDGKRQIFAVKSTDGWIRTLVAIEVIKPTYFTVSSSDLTAFSSRQGRALDKIWLPWTMVTLNATIWTIVFQLVLREDNADPDDSWEFFFGIVLNTSLSFLLVFRLNRAAERYWLARENWGVIVGAGREIVSETLVHGAHDPCHRDEVIRWIGAFSVATMQFMRSIPHIPPEFLEGVLEKCDVQKMEQAPNPTIYAADQARSALKKLFNVTADTPTSLAIAYSAQLNSIELLLNRIMDQEGAMERIKSTPLPLVYVAHLRTFLISFLAALPYVWVRSWGWATIPVVALASFSLLGLEGASEECEAPFKRNRANHMNMDAFCLLLLSNIQQSITHAANREIDERAVSPDDEIDESAKNVPTEQGMGTGQSNQQKPQPTSN